MTSLASVIGSPGRLRVVVASIAFEIVFCWKEFFVGNLFILISGFFLDISVNALLHSWLLLNLQEVFLCKTLPIFIKAVSYPSVFNANTLTAALNQVGLASSEVQCV